MTHQRNPNKMIHKSFDSKDPIVKYCVELSVKQHPLQAELCSETLTIPMGGMIGAPEVLQLGQNLIRSIKAKKVLDIGTFTGASAFAWALASAPGAQVDSFDVSHGPLDTIGRPIINKAPEAAAKINFHLKPAVDGLDELIAAGQEDTYDFAFIDADKENYSNYYERVMKLLRPSGAILIDNALRGGEVTKEESRKTNSMVKGIDDANRLIFNDPNSSNSLINMGDGVNLVFKN